jgi:hypothetical protein
MYHKKVFFMDGMVESLVDMFPFSVANVLLLWEIMTTDNESAGQRVTAIGQVLATRETVDT